MLGDHDYPAAKAVDDNQKRENTSAVEPVLDLMDTFGTPDEKATPALVVGKKKKTSEEDIGASEGIYLASQCM